MDPNFPARLPLYPGDVNSDGQVNISDLNVLLNNWMGDYASANFTDSGQINISDLNLLLANWMAESVVTYSEASQDEYTIDELFAAGLIDVVRNDDGTIRIIDGIFTNMRVHSERDAANVLNAFSDLFGSGFYADTTNITVQSVGDGTSKESFFRYNSYVNGITVLGSQIILATSYGGVVQGVFSTYDPRINSIDYNPTITVANAEEIALQAFLSEEEISNALNEVASALDTDRSELEAEFLTILATDTQLFVHAADSIEMPALVWAVAIDIIPEDYDSDILYLDDYIPLPFISMTYYIYANGDQAGEVLIAVSNILYWSNATITAPDLLGNTRTINVQSENNRFRLRDNPRNLETFNTTFSRNWRDLWLVSRPNLPGSIVSGTMGTNPSRSAVSAHANKAFVFDYFRDVLGRNSFDGFGARVVTSIGYSTRASATFRNAFWMTSRQQFGYGNAGNFEAAIDVVAHEFTHAVINYVVGNGRNIFLGSANYNHSQAGALNEAYSDIMGIIIAASNRGYARWRLAEDSDQVIRDLSVSRHFRNFNVNRACCHTNSMIFSHAAFLMMTDNRTSAVTNDMWAHVFYRSLYRLTTNATFSDAASAVISSARTQGFTDDQLRAVERGFVEVGIRFLSDWQKIDYLVAWAKQQPQAGNAPYYYFYWRGEGHEYWIIFFDTIDTDIRPGLSGTRHNGSHQVPYAAINTNYDFVYWGFADASIRNTWPGRPRRFMQTNNRVLYDRVHALDGMWQRGIVHIN